MLTFIVREGGEGGGRKGKAGGEAGVTKEV